MNDKASQGTFLKPNVAILIDVLKKNKLSTDFCKYT